MNPEILAQFGGIWFILTMFHFIADWIFQTEKEALNKSKPNASSVPYLTRHCMSYTLLMTLGLLLLGMRGTELAISWAVLFISHMIEDTYLPVYLWAKYIRRPTISKRDIPTSKAVGEACYKSSKIETVSDFGKLWLRNGKATVPMILLITIDQIVHISVLALPAWLLMN